MTVPLDFPTNFAIGSLVALSAGARLKKDSSGEAARLVTRQAAWMSAWFGVCVSYEYLTYPDWMWAYLVDTSGMKHQVVLPLFWLGLVICGVLGARATSRPLRQGRWGAAVGVALAGLLATGAVFGATFHAYMNVGTRQEYDAGHATPLLQHAGLQAATPWTIGLVAIAGLALVLTNIVRGRKP